MILIVSYPDNEHVDEVMKHLTRDAVVVDTASFPVSLGLSVAMNGEREDLQMALPEGRRIRLCQIGAVWYRRISPYGFHEELRDPTARLFAWSEANEALLGVWYSMGAYWMNPPLADEVAQRKIRQLQVARQVGLTIPDTVVTNEPDVAQMFVQQHGVGRVVRKAFRNIAEAPRETHLLRAEDLSQLDSVAYTPVIFQEYVPAALDLRVTIVEDDVFAAAVTSESEYAADYRPGLASATVVPYDLPGDVAAKLHALMSVFGLHYGAIDLRLTPEGDYVFLEVNPAGEYLFISKRTEQPISKAIAAALERRDKARQSGVPC
jgi:glutathione synthase/RimK-type ligase-like ATP-grasp enzyme